MRLLRLVIYIESITNWPEIGDNFQQLDIEVFCDAIWQKQHQICLSRFRSTNTTSAKKDIGDRNYL